MKKITMKRMLFLLFGAVAVAGLIASSAIAKGPGGGPGGGGGKGGGGRPSGPGEEAANNLSVPAIFVPDTTGGPTLAFPCGSLEPPTGETTFFEFPFEGDPGDYYIQGEDQWQAECAEAPDGLDVHADWGDNLLSAPLKAGTPIRTEIGLLAEPDLGMSGFTVFKLTDELDRLATYGTLGDEVDSFGETRVWDADVSLRIERSDGFVVYDGPFTAEINSTGRVVYGFNWQKPLAGDYTITVTAPNVIITSQEAGDVDDAGHIITLDVTVAARAGGGKGGKQ